MRPLVLASMIGLILAVGAPPLSAGQRARQRDPQAAGQVASPESPAPAPRAAPRRSPDAQPPEGGRQVDPPRVVPRRSPEATRPTPPQPPQTSGGDSRQRAIARPRPPAPDGGTTEGVTGGGGQTVTTERGGSRGMGSRVNGGRRTGSYATNRGDVRRPPDYPVTGYAVGRSAIEGRPFDFAYRPSRPTYISHRVDHHAYFPTYRYPQLYGTHFFFPTLRVFVGGHFGGYYDPYYYNPFWYDPYRYDRYDPYYYRYQYRGYGLGRPGYPDYLFGSLRLEVRPRHAEVYVDGYYVGRVDDFDGIFQRLDLEEGAHTIEVREPGYESLVFEVLIRPGQTITYEGDLRRFP